MNRVLLRMGALLAAISGSYSFGVRSATADCFNYTLSWPPACDPCADVECDYCHGGTCTNTRQICTPLRTLVEHAASGWTSVMIKLDAPCFKVYTCVANEGGSCTVDNYCRKGAWVSDSSTTFQNLAFTGACP